MKAVGTRPRLTSVIERIDQLERQIGTKEKLLAELETANDVALGDQRLHK